MIKSLEARKIINTASLTLDFKRDADLPPMAWALRHEAGSSRADVLTGSDVRSGNGIFWEGVNQYVNDPARIVNHHFPLCSGALSRDGQIIAFTPGHTLDRLFLLRQERTLFLSNSLPFVLRAAKARLKPRDLTYHWHLGAIGAHEQDVPIDGGELTAYINANIIIESDHSVRWEVRPKTRDFTTYSEYRAALDAFLGEAAAAAAHPVNLAYTPITTISTGYDSPAASVLARSIGAETALTIGDSRGGPSDSGAEIARIIGLDIVTGSRTEYRAYGVEAERLFYFGAVGNDIIFYPWKDLLRGKLLFTGYKGDMLWDRNWLRPLGPWSYDADGATMQEFRLRSGFVHLPPAYFGWRRADRLLAISKSEDMAPWTLNSDYDRPIARRIVEEAGVPRDLFGQTKKMVTSTVGVDKTRYITIDDVGLSPEFRERLRAHHRAWTGLGLSTSFAVNNGVHGLMRGAHWTAHAARRALSGKKKPQSKPVAAPARRASAPGLKDRLFFELEFQLPYRRTFMTPFTDLNFAAQVANDLLQSDYRGF